METLELRLGGNANLTQNTGLPKNVAREKGTGKHFVHKPRTEDSDTPDVQHGF